MGEERERPTPASSPPEQSLAEYLTYVRGTKRMTLREVEEASDREISNAYLSQLEKGHISKPSPNILHALAEVYGISYERLMEKAGYIVATSAAKGITQPKKHGRVATFADEHLTAQEEEELLKYLAFLRSRSKRRKT
jgi:HTH-type transcriptional regulator, competence development regulator